MPNGTGRTFSGLLSRLRLLTLLDKFLASRLQFGGQLNDHCTECADVDAMKLPINPDSETVRSAANHLCGALFQLTLQLYLCFVLPS